mgnify:CR=1 FL=1
MSAPIDAERADPSRDLAREFVSVFEGLAASVVHVPTTTSTNDLAKEAARAGCVHGALFLADAQTAGRGRQGRAWSSPSGENLLLSVVYRSPLLRRFPARRPLVPLATGLAVAHTIADVLPAPARAAVKWPNDVLVFAGETRKKIAGILVEVVGDALVVGIGINVSTTDFPEEIASVATSIAAVRGDHAIGRRQVVQALLGNLEHEIERVLAGGFPAIRARYEAAWCMQNAPVWVAAAGGPAKEGSSTAAGYAATVLGLDDDGHLKVVDDAGIVHLLNAGDVHLAPR